MEAETLSEARVYVGAFGKYNNGSLLGVWLDLSDYSDKEDFYAFCREFCNDEEDADDLVRDFQDEYLGQYDDEEDFAYQIVKVRFDEPQQWGDDLYTEDWHGTQDGRVRHAAPFATVGRQTGLSDDDSSFRGAYQLNRPQYF